MIRNFVVNTHKKSDGVFVRIIIESLHYMNMTSNIYLWKTHTHFMKSNI